jgi:hypothetical protein
MSVDVAVLSDGRIRRAQLRCPLVIRTAVFDGPDLRPGNEIKTITTKTFKPAIKPSIA